MDDPAVTGLGGTVLRLNDKPLAGITVSIDKRSVRTDRQGRFEVTGIAPGHYEVVVDGRTICGGKEYLSVIIGVDVRKQGLTELSYAVISRGCVPPIGSR
ncbi:MAG: carboxypeptidase-like regulatory domain-containing protein [Gammaproteobacteria bacterium]